MKGSLEERYTKKRRGLNGLENQIPLKFIDTPLILKKQILKGEQQNRYTDQHGNSRFVGKLPELTLENKWNNPKINH
jgi:hypothetical protein